MNDSTQKSENEIEERNFDFKRFFTRYLRYWYAFVISIVLGFFIAKYYNWYTPPIYKSSCRLIVKDENSNNSAENILKDLNNMKRDVNLENEIQILRSKTLITKAIKELEFDISYLLQGNIKSSELYNKSPFKLIPDTLNEFAYFSDLEIKLIDKNSFELSYVPSNSKELKSNTYRFNENIANEFGKFKIIKRENFDKELSNNFEDNKKYYKIHFNAIENLANYYAANLGIDVVSSGSSILELSIVDAVPEACSDFLNKLTEVYISNSSEQKNLLASNSIKFIDSQIQQISGELKGIEKTLLDFQTQKGIVNIDDESKMFLEKVKNYDEQISENKIQISFINYLEKYILDNKKINDLSPTSLGINDPQLIKQISILSELENEYNLRQMDSKTKSPLFENIEKQIKHTKQSILENLKGIKQKYILSQNEISSDLNKVEGKLGSLPKTEIEFVSIKRQFSIKEGLYLYLLQKRSETSIVLASSASNNWVIDKAEPNYTPIKPIKSKTYVIALVLSILIPIFIISIIEILNDKINDRESLESQTKIPLIGILGNNSDDSNLFTESKPSPVIMEGLRSIRTNINYFLNNSTDNKKNNIILVTSSISGEGKTFISYNLAGILALSEKKTILVSLDLRKPKVINGIVLNSEYGITNYLSGTSEILDIISTTKIPFLDIIFSGPIPPNPTELILKERIKNLFEYLKEKYDYIIIDTPPIGLVPDGLELTKFSDVNIYVVRQNITRKHHLKFISKLYSEKKINNVGIIFNSVKIPDNGYGYGYEYGYGYGYGYMNEFDKKSKNKLSNIFRKNPNI